MVRGRQLKVYLHPDDRPAVDAYVHGELESLLLKERSNDPDGFEVLDSREGGMGRLICPRSAVGHLEPRYVETRDEWILGVQGNPLVEWWFSKLNGGLLYPGRFYYMPSDSPSTSGRDYPPDFMPMAKRLFKWVRSETVTVETEWGAERVGPVAEAMLRAGSITLRRNPPGSRI